MKLSKVDITSIFALYYCVKIKRMQLLLLYTLLLWSMKKPQKRMWDFEIGS